jgi:hypothetical protein
MERDMILPITHVASKADPISLDTVSTTMTGAKEAQWLSGRRLAEVSLAAHAARGWELSAAYRREQNQLGLLGSKASSPSKSLNLDCGDAGVAPAI